MKCRELAEKLIDFVAGDLPEDVKQRIAEHLCQCGPCERFVGTYKMTIEISARLPPVAIPPDAMQRLRQAMAHAEQEETT